MKLPLPASALFLPLSLTPPALPQQADLVLSGSFVGGEFGASLACAGDVDGDGLPDLIVGAPSEDSAGTDAGAARVFSGADGHEIFTFLGPAGGRMGFSVAAAGDADGDGRADVIVGLPGAGSTKGKARVYSGATGALIYGVAGPASGGFLGWSVTGIGDANGDGLDDQVVGLPGIGAGEAWVLSGLDGSVLRTLAGDLVHEQFGLAVSGVGDVDGDGRGDVIVGAPDQGPDPGSAWVFSGADGSLLHLFLGTADHDFLGLAVGGGGDADGDGVPDLAYGGRGDGSGFVRVHSGATGALLREHVGFDDHFGNALDLRGDFDGDGLADLVVGSYAVHASEVDSHEGNVRVYSGGDGALVFSATDARPKSWMGWAVDCGGDYDKDGLDDLVVGAPQLIATGVGKALVLRGRGAVGTRYCTPGVPNSTGVPGSLAVLGSAAVADNWLTLVARDLPAGGGGYFLVGDSQAFVPQPGGSQGNLCLGGLRLAPPVWGTLDWGALVLRIDLDALPEVGVVQPGETWYFQAWYQDQNPQPTSNFSDAVAVSFL